MEVAGIRPIKECFLRPNYLGALEFSEGWIFFRVLRRTFCQYKPYPVIDENGNTIDIPPLSYETEHEFRDPRSISANIIYLESNLSPEGYPWFYHGAIGIKPNYINMYFRVPKGASVSGQFLNLSPVRPRAGDNFAYLCSENSPYEEPTDYEELVITPRVTIGAEYYNKDDKRSHQPTLNLDFCLYRIQILDKEKYGKIISDIAARRVPVAFLTAGSSRAGSPLAMGELMRRDWKVEPMSLDEALELR